MDNVHDIVNRDRRARGPPSTHQRSGILYDALLDSLEDEPISRADEPLDLGEDPVEAIDVEEDDLDRAVLDDDEEHDPELDLAAEELLAGVEDESWSDDPVRMYLTQMGEIPLLTRQQEVALAKQIEIDPRASSAARCWNATT